MKLLILVVDILKMCMWVFDIARINVDRMTAFLHCRVQSLSNQLLLKFSTDFSQTLQTYCGHSECLHMSF